MFVLPLSATVSRRAASPRAVDRLFEASLDRLLAGSARPSVCTPAMDVAESDVRYTLRFDVPGASREQLDVSVHGREVTLATAQPEAPAADDAPAPAATAERVLHRERAAPRYARTVRLPEDVDASSAEARVDNGVLTLTLAKKVPSGARRINVA